MHVLFVTAHPFVMFIELTLRLSQTNVRQNWPHKTKIGPEAQTALRRQWRTELLKHYFSLSNILIVTVNQTLSVIVRTF